MKINIYNMLVLSLCVLALSGSVNALGCTYTTVDDGSDYFGINTVNVNTTSIGADQLWTSFTAFTPRLNISKNVSEIIVGQAVNGISALAWRTPVNFSSTLTVWNGSVAVGVGNYSLQYQGNENWAINWTTANYLGNDITVNFTRIFIKNKDDLVLNASGVYTAASTFNFITQSSPTAYGDDKTFKFNGDSLGAIVNNTNWAVTWQYTNRVCEGTNPEAITGINSTKLTIFAAFGLLAVLLLALVAFGIIKIFSGAGSVDLIVLAVLVVGGAVLLFVGYVIVSYVATALGAV